MISRAILRLLFVCLAVGVCGVLPLESPLGSLLCGGGSGGMATVAAAEPLLAGVGKVDITNVEAGPVSDPLFARALVLKSGSTTAVLVTVDAVSIGEIGYIGNDYLPKVRERLVEELKIDPTHFVVNASHCHGIVCKDVAERTVQAVKQAFSNLVPAKTGVGVGQENRVSENRRLKLKSGKEADVRHAYSLPPDDEVVGTGPIDPQIGILKIERLDGRPLAVVYNFACHPIQGVPSGGNTADITGFSSKAIEESLGEGSVALFVQGCAGDINPTKYKDVDGPRDAEPLGNLLGLSVLRALKQIKTAESAPLKIVNSPLELPRADLAPRIESLQQEQATVLRSLRGTSLNLKTFVPLYVKYHVSADFPSYYSHRYMHEKAINREDLANLDAANRRNLNAYVNNIHAMELLTRMQTNLDLLKKHQAQNLAAPKRMLDVEVVGLRVGEFVLVTFPGELTVQIGLNIKQKSPHPNTFVAGYTNGYIYYSPTEEQLKNVGNAQEDSDCILAPGWQSLFEDKVAEVLKKL